jgi:hypothetical protein
MPELAKLITKAALYEIVLLFGTLTLVLFPGITGAEVLQEGTWDGTYTKSQFLAQYVVTNTTEGAETISSIKMILPELEPQSDFTFEIKDVQIKENSLTFTIHKLQRSLRRLTPNLNL